MGAFRQCRRTSPDQCRRVRHDPHHMRLATQFAFDTGCRHARRDRDEQLAIMPVADFKGARTADICCGLTASNTMSASATAFTLSSAVRMPKVLARTSNRSGRTSVAMICDGVNRLGRQQSANQRFPHVSRRRGMRSSYSSGSCRFLSPKMAAPMRTSVAPSSIATSKSWVMPIESSRKSSASRSSRNRRKYGRAFSFSSA